MDLIKASLKEITDAVCGKQVSAVEVCDFFLNRAEKLNTSLNAFISFNPHLKKEAQAIDEKIAQGQAVGLLAGVPWGIKDMFCTQGLKTTAASKILADFIPCYDATAVKRLKNQGALILGKLNQDEFAMGSSSENSYFGAVKNPWKISCVAGGSSGGSAAAQSARMVAASTGTDTGGSIRQPASFCGVVGVKPTYGRISRYGIIAYASSLDQAGPMTNSVQDAALSLEVMCGKDPLDSTSSERPVPTWSKSLNKNIKGLRIGLLKEAQSNQGLQAEVRSTNEKAIQSLQQMGAEIVEVTLPLLNQAVPTYYLVASSEASSNLSRYDGVKYGFRSDFKSLSHLSLQEFYSSTRGEGFGTEVKRRIMLGTYCLSSGYYDAYYKKASQVRRLMVEHYEQCFKSCDVILSPVTTTTAFALNEKIDDPLQMYLNDIFTVSVNLAGLPAMSLPFGFSKDRMPIGVQLIAPAFEEQKMLNVACALEEVSGLSGLVANV